MARGHAQKAALHAKQSVSIGFDSDIGASLRRYADYIKDEALRSAAYAAARILYDEMRLVCPVWKGDIYTVKTGKNAGKANATPGQLRDAIYHWHDAKQSAEDRQVYAVGPNKRTAPHWHWVEYGTSKMLARSYVRKAWENKSKDAMEAAKKRLTEKLKEFDGSQ